MVITVGHLCMYRPYKLINFYIFSGIKCWSLTYWHNWPLTTFFCQFILCDCMYYYSIICYLLLSMLSYMYLFDDWIEVTLKMSQAFLSPLMKRIVFSSNDDIAKDY